MRRARALLPLLAAAALLVGCSDAGSLKGVMDASVDAKTRPEVVAAATPEAGGTRETTVGVDGSAAAEAAASSPEPFVAGRRMHGGVGLKVDTILAVRHGVHGDFERVVLDLGAGSEPAGSVPRWVLENPGGGLLRFYLPSVNATGVSDGEFGNGLLESFHVVRAPDGGMFVDVVAGEGFRYRVLELAEPARLVVDLQPADVPLRKPAPAEGGDTVLVEPRAGDRISDPLTVSGYSRNVEASNTIILEDSRGKVLFRETVSSNDWTSTWGYFEATLDLPPFPDKGTLRVGAQSARDGSFRGVEIPVSGG